MKKIIATTGPSVFNDEVKELIQGYYGACPLYVINDDQEDLDWIANNSDALMLAGGVDIFPGTLSKIVATGNGYSKFDIKRDRRELYLYDKFRAMNKPIALICRGFQLVLCARFGFRLISDISDSTILHSPGANKIDINYYDGEYAHPVNFTAPYKNRFKQNEDDEKFTDWSGVASAHHQAVIETKNSNPIIKIVAISGTRIGSKDNQEIVEMIECPEMKIVGGQFHWEVCTDNFAAHRGTAEIFREYLNQ